MSTIIYVYKMKEIWYPTLRKCLYLNMRFNKYIERERNSNNIITRDKKKCTDTNPMVVIKLVVKEPSENLKSKQLFPTPTNS